MADHDWRLTNQLSYMKGATLSWRTWERPSETWDHDHCQFCGAKFMERAGPDIELAGYMTEDEHERWVCKQCFEDFREMFEWRVEGEPP
jgi:hypothetical protein